MRTHTQKMIDEAGINIEKLGDEALLMRMAHCYHRSLTAIDPTFKARWREVYDRCKREVLERLGHELIE